MAPGAALACPSCGHRLAELEGRIAALEDELRRLRARAGAGAGGYPRVAFTVRDPPPLDAETARDPARDDVRIPPSIGKFVLMRVEGIEEGNPRMRRIFASDGVRRQFPAQNLENVQPSTNVARSADTDRAAIETLLRARATRRPTVWTWRGKGGPPRRGGEGRKPALSDLVFLTSQDEDGATAEPCIVIHNLCEYLGESDAGPLFMCTVFDADEREKREKQLQRFQQLLDLAPGWVFWATMEGRIVFHSDNDYFHALTHCTADEVMDLGWRDFVPPDFLDAPTAAPGLAPLPARVWEGVWRRRDGTPAYVRAAVRAHRDSLTGRPYRLGFLADRLPEHALAAALARAESASAAKDRLLASVSHELRTPLGGVLGIARLLREAPGLGEDERRLVDLLCESGGTLEALIEDLLEYSRMELGNLPISPSPCSPRDAVTAVVSALRASGLRNPSVSLSSAVDAAVPDTVVADAGRLKQVLYNLVGNALKFTQAGGVAVRVGVGTAPAENGAAGAGAGKGVPNGLPSPPPEGDGVDAEVEGAGASSDAAEARTLVVEVEDSGCGIAAGDLDRLFKPFSRVTSPKARKVAGVGLGLSISKRLVEKMGGRMWVRSAEGSGSTFGFSLPVRVLAPEESPPPDAVPAERSSRPNSRDGPPKWTRRAHPPFRLPETSVLVRRPPRLLLADDNAVNRTVAQRFLGRLGLAADEVADGVEAVERVRGADGEGRGYDAVLMDVQMPIMDGLEAARTIRALPLRGRPPRLVALTAGGGADRAGLAAAGLTGFLAKPLSLEALARALEEAVEDGGPPAAAAEQNHVAEVAPLGS